MAFDPHRDTSVVSGAFSVDVNQLCSVYTLLTYEETLSIGPAKAALNTALWEADLGATLFPDATAGLIDAINTALEALGTLESTVNSLLWKLQDAALTYGDAESMASLWEAVPGSPMGPQLTAGGIARYAVAGGMPGAVRNAVFHMEQDIATRAGVPWLPTVISPVEAFVAGGRDMKNTVVSFLVFTFHGDEQSGAQFQRDLGRVALDLNSCPAYRFAVRQLAGVGVSRNINSNSTSSEAGIAALISVWLTRRGINHGFSYGVAVTGSGQTRVHHNGAAPLVPPNVLAARTQATLAAMPDTAPDSHYEGAATSADIIDHISDMRGGDSNNGEIAIEEHVTVGEDGTLTRSWTVDIRGTQSFGIGETGPQDTLANLQGVGAMSSDQLDAIKEAMDAAGIAPGEAVEFAGHSQGGIMATQMAADPTVRARYNVVSVVTAGSPTATIAPDDVPVLAYENFGDIVPGCDGTATRGDNVTTVMFHDYEATCDASDPVPCSHSVSVYVDEIRASLSAATASSDPGLRALATAEARRTQALGLTHNTQTTIHHYQTRRITAK